MTRFKSAISNWIFFLLTLTFIPQAQAGRKEFIEILVESGIGRAYLRTTEGARLVEQILGPGRAGIRSKAELQEFIQAFRTSATDEQIRRAVSDVRDIKKLMEEQALQGTSHTAFATNLERPYVLDEILGLNLSENFAIQSIRATGRFEIVPNLPAVPAMRFSKPKATQVRIKTSPGLEEVDRLLTEIRGVRKGSRAHFVNEEEAEILRSLGERKTPPTLETYPGESLLTTSEIRDVFATSETLQGRLYQARLQTPVATPNAHNLSGQGIRLHSELQLFKMNPVRRPLEQHNQLLSLFENADPISHARLSVSGSLGDFDMIFLGEAQKTVRSVGTRKNQNRYFYFYERVATPDGEVYFIIARVKQRLDPYYKRYTVDSTEVNYRILPQEESFKLPEEESFEALKNALQLK